MNYNEAMMVAYLFNETEPLNEAKLRSFYQVYLDDFENNEGQAITAMMFKGFPPQLLDKLVQAAQVVTMMESIRDAAKTNEEEQS